MALIGNTFYQDSSLDPGVGYPMYYWNQTNTGLVYIRNAADTAWVLVGDSAQPYLGQLSTQGGTMNGAIAGAHGLSPADANDFTASLRVGGLDVATRQYVDAQDAALRAEIATGIASAISSIPALAVSSKIVFNKGTWSIAGYANGLVIPLPIYSDGVTAAQSECLWGAYFVNFGFGYYASGNTSFAISETSPRVFEIASRKDGGATNFNSIVQWFILAIRKG